MMRATETKGMPPITGPRNSPAGRCEQADRMMELSYRRHRFPPVVIQHAVWLYLRFTLSYRGQSLLLLKFVTGLSRLFPATGAIYRAITSGENYVGRQPGLRRRCGNGVTCLDGIDRSKAVDASIDPRRVH
jgi:hypothetical protein